MAMASTISFSGPNSGFQVGKNSGQINVYHYPATDQACLRHLQTTNPRHDKNRIERDKGGLLKDAYGWILDNADFKRWRFEQQSQLLWIKGGPGKGKTMLLCGIINELTNSAPGTVTVSFFFCQASDARINHATAVLRGLIFMLVDQQPSLIPHIRRQYDKTGKQVFEDVNAWEALSEILTSILEDPLLRTTYLVIDALDECTTDRNRLLELVTQKSSVYPRVKWIVSSRNWPAIEETLNAATHKTKLWLELNETSVAEAVANFIDYKVLELTEKKNYNKEIRDAVSQHLLSNAHGTFLWVALVCENLGNVPKRDVRKKLEEFPFGLDKLYKQMLSQIDESDNAELCKSLLGVTITVCRPITLDEMASFIDIPKEVTDDIALAEIMGHCGSFLTLQGRTISLVHQSAKDFLLREAGYKIFPNGVEKVHHSIFSKSLQVIARILHRDIYGLVAPGYPIDQVIPPDPDPLAATRYACIYWVYHLNECFSSRNANKDLQENDSVGMFLRQDYLHWLEALSLSRSFSDGVASMLRLESLLKTTTQDAQLIKRVRDACRFIRYHKTAIENQPLQVYASGMVFSPTGSITRTQFETQEPAWIIRRPTMEHGWRACLQTIDGHHNIVSSVTFSHDSKLLASASFDHTVKLWDASSGQCLQTLKGHRDPVRSVTFSHDSRLLASASEDKTVKVWDTSSGQCFQTLKGHRGWVWSVTFSHDSKLLASASDDKTVKVWDTSSGQYLQTVKGHRGWVRSVTFSHDSKLLASASDDNTVKVWDASSGQCLQTVKGHHRSVSTVTFSYDSKLLASASDDNTVKVWDASSGQCLQTLKGHRDWVKSVTFSHDSKLLASASYDKTVKVWDASSGQCLQTLEGHRLYVGSVTFSHDSKLLASASKDSTVKVWDASSGECLQTLEGHPSWSVTSLIRNVQLVKGHRVGVTSVTFSHDSKLLASSSNDGAVKVWDASTGQCLQTLNGHSVGVTSVTFSHDSKLLASASSDSTVKVWDASSGQCLQTLEGHPSWSVTSLIRSVQSVKGHRVGVTSVTFSHDSKLLASSSNDGTVKVWNASSGQCLQTLKGHRDPVRSVTFSHDSRLLASASEDKTVKVWDTSSGQCLQTVKGHRDPVRSVTFSHDSKLLASASSDSTVKVWDASSGQCLQTLKGHRVTSVKSIDSSNSYLETNNGTILLSLASDTGPTNTDPEVLRFKGYGISSDGICITWNSENLLWLPPEYRPRVFAVSLSTICLGCDSGRVLFFTFDSQKLRLPPCDQAIERSDYAR